jgi:acetyltransferase-like isoleucine patch superfamily enzyme
VAPITSAPPPRDFAGFGDGSWIVPPAVVEHPELISIGAGVIILEHGALRVRTRDDGRPKLVVRDRVRLARLVTVHCTLSIEIGEAVSTSDEVTITDTWGPLDAAPGLLAAPPRERVVIEDGAYLGAGCVIGPGVRVGAGAFVGERAVVINDVPAHAVVYGNPATVVSS